MLVFHWPCFTPPKCLFSISYSLHPRVFPFRLSFCWFYLRPDVSVNNIHRVHHGSRWYIIQNVGWFSLDGRRISYITSLSQDPFWLCFRFTVCWRGINRVLQYKGIKLYFSFETSLYPCYYRSKLQIVYQPSRVI